MRPFRANLEPYHQVAAITEMECSNLSQMTIPVSYSYDIWQKLFHFSEITLTDEKGVNSTQKHSVDYNNRNGYPCQLLI